MSLLLLFTALCQTFWAVSAVLCATLAAVGRGPASALPIERANARMIQKNAFMVLKVSLLTDRVRLSDCRRDCAVDRRFKLHKRGQLLIRMHNETLSIVAVCVSNPDCSPIGSIAETQPQLQPALLRLSARTSQYFTRRGV